MLHPSPMQVSTTSPHLHAPDPSPQLTPFLHMYFFEASSFQRETISPSSQKIYMNKFKQEQFNFTTSPTTYTCSQQALTIIQALPVSNQMWKKRETWQVFFHIKKESRIQVMPYIIKQGGREANTHHRNNRIRTAPSCLFQYGLIFGEVYRDWFVRHLSQSLSSTTHSFIPVCVMKYTDIPQNSSHAGKLRC